ncbi:Nucleolar protein 6 [Paragonimus heterotremus]|uniref:Nucleolar protein 6 n=1 Tax=Paragonimus heterotremus TaxID=100268 RepID=A0A8J4WFH5_9TREM|nr:Nucleolar protein 6 [Paragonimus heterotremus]
MDPVESFDHLLIFRTDHLLNNTAENDCAFSSLDNLANIIVEDLSEALKGRITRITKVVVPINGQTNLPGIGLKIKGQETYAALIKGPPSSSGAGELFRSFWGNKAELRRIDGELLECVVWSPTDNVLKQIIDYILQSRFRLTRGSFTKPAWMQITSDSLRALCSTNFVGSRTGLTFASSVRLIRSMDKLRVLLRGLNNKLPLNITGISAVSSAFRDTSVFPPVLTLPSAAREISRQRRRSTNTGKPVMISAAIFPLYVVITLEQAGKWPSNVEAFYHMKRLLVIRIHELLSPVGVPSHVTQNNMLDIFLDGLVFRVSIAHAREVSLLQTAGMPDKATSDNGFVDHFSTGSVSCVGEPPDAVPITQTSNSLGWIHLNHSLPKVSGLLASVSRSEHHVFPEACRLAKRWLSAHGYPVILCPLEAEFDGLRHIWDRTSSQQLERRRIIPFDSLSDHWTKLGSDGRMMEIAVELLVLHAAGFSYTLSHCKEQSPLDQASDSDMMRRNACGSPVAAFLRFLKLLATYDWAARPLLVDLNDGFSDLEKRRLALKSMQKGREFLPAMVICTPLDLQGTDWTSLGPTRSGLKELQGLAAQCRTLLRAMLVSGAPLKESVFRPSHKNLDILLILKPEIACMRAVEAIDFTFPRNQKHVNTLSFPPVDQESLLNDIPSPGARFWPIGYCCDPVGYIVHDLQARVGQHCAVLWDRHGGDWIGIKWRSSVINDSSKRPFALESLNGLMVHTQGSSSSVAKMFVKARLTSVTDLLPDWAVLFAQSFKVLHHDSELHLKHLKAV